MWLSFHHWKIAEGGRMDGRESGYEWLRLTWVLNMLNKSTCFSDQTLLSLHRLIKTGSWKARTCVTIKYMNELCNKDGLCRLGPCLLEGTDYADWDHAFWKGLTIQSGTMPSGRNWLYCLGPCLLEGTDYAVWDHAFWKGLTILSLGPCLLEGTDYADWDNAFWKGLTIQTQTMPSGRDWLCCLGPCLLEGTDYVVWHLAFWKGLTIQSGTLPSGRDWLYSLWPCLLEGTDYTDWDHAFWKGLTIQSVTMPSGRDWLCSLEPCLLEGTDYTVCDLAFWKGLTMQSGTLPSGRDWLCCLGSFRIDFHAAVSPLLSNIVLNITSNLVHPTLNLNGWTYYKIPLEDVPSVSLMWYCNIFTHHVITVSLFTAWTAAAAAVQQYFILTHPSCHFITFNPYCLTPFSLSVTITIQLGANITHGLLSWLKHYYRSRNGHSPIYTQGLGREKTML